MTEYRPPRYKALEADRRSKGLAPAEITAKIVPGAVFLAKDEAINFPTTRIPGTGRTAHNSRFVIVVDREQEATADKPKSVSVIPCSASSRGEAAPFEYDIPEPQRCGFDAESVRALVLLVQPILKSELGAYMGRLPPATLTELQVRLALKFGLLPDPGPALNLPPAKQESPAASAPKVKPKQGIPVTPKR